MGIYRTLLEEEVPHLDDNNNPDDQIKELQDVIEDHDANEAEQKAAQDAAFGPDGGVDDIMDESAMAIYEFEAGHAAIMQAIGIHELQEAASGREFIMEAADIKGFFVSVKKKVGDFFKKVWQVLQRWAGNIGAVFTSNKKFVEKYGKQMEEGYAALKGKNDSKMKMYTFDGVDKAIALAKAGKKDKFDDASDDIIKAIKDAAATNSKVANGSTAEEIEADLNATRGAFVGKDSVSSSDYSSELKKYLYGSDEPKEDLMAVADVKAILSGKKDDRKSVKDFMDNAKREYKKIMDSLSSAERAASKMEAGVNRNSVMAECTRYSTLIRGTMTAAQTWRNATLSAINARARQARRYGMAYVAASNKGKYKGFQKESAEYGFLGSLGLV